MSDLDYTTPVPSFLRQAPASWRGRRSPRFEFAREAEQPEWAIVGLAVVALAAIAGVAAWMVGNWPSA